MKRCYKCDRSLNENNGYFRLYSFEKDDCIYLCSGKCLKRYEQLELQIKITKNVKERSNLC